ncbi:hypothetical protein ABPG72_019702 [Tetrahymena utriculariae]
MNDRLKELKNFRQHQGGQANNNPSKIMKQSVDIESQLSDQSMNLVPKYFQDDIQNSRNLLEKIKANTTQLEELKDEYSQATRSAKEKEISELIDMNLTDNTKYVNQLKGILDRIDFDVKQAKEDKDRQGDAQKKQILYNQIVQASQQTLLESQKAQDAAKITLKNKTSRQIRLISPDMTEQQIEEIAEDPNRAQQIFQQKMFKSASIQLQNAVSDVQDKYKEILKLQRSIMQLHQMMQDLAMLVAHQGEIIDNIEVLVEQTVNNVGKANKALTKAKEHHQSAKKKMCILLVIVAAVLAIILGTTLK